MKNKVKQMLSIVMTVCMLATVVPFTAYGADVDFSDDTAVTFESEDDDEETTSDQTDVQIDADDDQTEENADVSIEAEDEESNENEENLFTSDETEQGMEDMFSDSVGINVTSKPSDGTTNGQPFAAGTGGSQNFRIPAMVTLSDGTIVAATDARWNTTFDGQCLDTIVSRSQDNGATWNYTFANYLGDNGNKQDPSSTAFIDPVLAVDKNDTIYMLVDLFPAGAYISDISAGTGYDDAGHLKLSTSGNSGNSTYDYYLDENTIYNANTNDAIVGLSVDDHFNLTGTYNNVTYNTNLFFADSPFQVLKTSYLYLTKSSDGGSTWSAPSMLNSQVKYSSETFYGVGPGRGLTTVLSDGSERIILPCYNYNGGIQYTSVIYSDDGGVTWTRSASMSNQSSEATLTEADGNIYMFTRGGGYYVSSDKGSTWSTRKEISGIGYYTECQINAITYSKKVDGKTAILLSAPTNQRNNGTIFTGLVQEDGSIQWKYKYQVNNSTYQYSCMTELKDGSIALLYENGDASELFATYKIETIANGAVVGEKGNTDNNGNSGSNNNGSNGADTIITKNITLSTGSTSQTFLQDGEYSYDGSDEYVNVSTEIKDKESGTYYESAAFGTGTFYVSGQSGDNNPATTLTFESAGNGRYYVKNVNGKYICPYNGYVYTSDSKEYALKVTDNGDSSISIAYNYRGTYYLTVSGSELGCSTSQSKVYLYAQKTSMAGKQTSVVFTGKKVGSTQITIGNVCYEITVVDRGGSYDASVAVGGSAELSIPDTVGADEKVVWTSVDYTKTGVYSEDGKNATITGREKGTTAVNATVYDKGGNQAAVYNWNVTVTDGETPNTGDYTVTITSENKIYNGKLYYSIAGGSLVEVPVADVTTDADGNKIYTYQKIDLTVKNVKYTQLELFVKPDDGYAVTSITDTTGKSYAQFYGIDKDKLQVVYGDKHQGAKLNDVMTEEQEKALLAEAVAEGCDAVFWYTRGTETGNLTQNDKIESAHLVHCDKLPTISKKMAYLGVDEEYIPYTEDMVAHEGDTAVFKITVTKYKESADIVYSDLKITDVMQNVSGSVKLYKGKTELGNPIDITDTINAGDGTSETTYEYYAVYTITKEDLDKEFVNTVNLAYNYSSTYSTGTYGGAATDNAKFVATNFPGIKDIVIDYGLPVSIKVGAWESAAGAGAVSVTGTSANDYADVSVTGDNTTGIDITYTPKAVLKSEDTVVLKAKSADGKSEVEYRFKVYPATTVYYEEGFASYSGTWSGASHGTGEQHKSEVGSKDRYGYDLKYENENQASNGSEAVTSVQGSTAEITFKGTGIDIYANCTNATGIVSVMRKQSGAIQEVLAIDTVAKAGSTENTRVPDSVYNVPVASIQNLTYGEYTAKITFSNSNKNTNKSVSIDGFRIYNTLTDEETVNNVYEQDNEANPEFVELRDQVLSSLSPTSVSDSKYADQIAKDTLNQVYSSAGATNGAVIVTDKESPYSGDVVKDLLDNGPKNEVYLYYGQEIVFTLNDDYKYQIGLKAINGSVNLKLNDAPMTLNSSTDMFYNIDGAKVKIKNNSTNILSITKLKAIGASGESPQALFAPLTEETLTTALVGLGYEKAPAPTATPTPTQKPAQQIKLDTPKLDKVAAVGHNALKVSWSKVKNADGYRVYVKENGKWKTVGDTKSTSYVHKNLKTGKSYTYTVKAYKKTADGTVWSSYNKKGITGKTVLKAPKLRRVKRNSAKKATLTWNKVDGANGYVVYRKTNNGSWKAVKRITKGNVTSFTDTKLSKGKKYTYTVRAYCTVDKKNVYSGYDKKGLTVK